MELVALHGKCRQNRSHSGVGMRLGSQVSLDKSGWPIEATTRSN